MIIREANKNDLNEILQLYLYLHEESVPVVLCQDLVQIKMRSSAC